MDSPQNSPGLCDEQFQPSYYNGTAGYMMPFGSERCFVRYICYKRNNCKEEENFLIITCIFKSQQQLKIVVRCFCVIHACWQSVRKDTNVNTLWAKTAIFIGMNGLPSWSSLSKSHITSIIWKAVKYR